MKNFESATCTTAKKRVPQVSNCAESELFFNGIFRTSKQTKHRHYDEGHEAGFAIKFNKGGVNINMSLNELTCFLHHLKWDRKRNFMPHCNLMVNLWKGKTVFVAKHFNYEYDSVNDIGKIGCYYVHNIEELDNPEIKVAELDEQLNF